MSAVWMNFKVGSQLRDHKLVVFSSYRFSRLFFNRLVTYAFTVPAMLAVTRPNRMKTTAVHPVEANYFWKELMRSNNEQRQQSIFGD